MRPKPITPVAKITTVANNNITDNFVPNLFVIIFSCRHQLPDVFYNKKSPRCHNDRRDELTIKKSVVPPSLRAKKRITLAFDNMVLPRLNR